MSTPLRNVDENTPPGRHNTLMTALVITSVVATGIVVAGLTATPEEPELTVQPVTPTPTEPPPPAEEYVVTYPEVEYPTDIPGCETVDEPVEPRYSSFVSNGEELYANPVAPWFSGPKAHLMSAALVDALPTGITFDRAVPYFGPIPVVEGAADEDMIDSTSASADISLGGKSGYFSVGVSQSADEVPPCVAGALDERTTLPDGTIVDTDDTWQEVNGDRTYSRSATAYRTDSSWISVYVAGADEASEFPLSLEDAIRIVSDPGLATTPAPPPGTPGSVAQCSSYGGSTDSGRTYTASEIDALNAALRQADTGALAPSPPLGSLSPNSWSGGLCQLVDSAAGRLSISFGDTPAPATDPSDAVLLNPGSFGSGTSVSVTTPSGKGVTITTEQPWDRADLERLASTPGLDLP